MLFYQSCCGFIVKHGYQRLLCCCGWVGVCVAQRCTKAKKQKTPPRSLCSLSLSQHSACKKKTDNKRKTRRKSLRFELVLHFGVRVSRAQLCFEGFEVRQRSRSLRIPAGPFAQSHLSQAGAAVDQEVERGVELQISVVGEFEALERLQLADECRDGAEAAVVEIELSQRPHHLQLCRERLVLGRVT